MTEGWGQFFMTQRGQFRMSFDTGTANQMVTSDYGTTKAGCWPPRRGL
jgi:hypothetical protein